MSGRFPNPDENRDEEAASQSSGSTPPQPTPPESSSVLGLFSAVEKQFEIKRAEAEELEELEKAVFQNLAAGDEVKQEPVVDNNHPAATPVIDFQFESEAAPPTVAPVVRGEPVQKSDWRTAWAAAPGESEPTAEIPAQTPPAPAEPPAVPAITEVKRNSLSSLVAKKSTTDNKKPPAEPPAPWANLSGTNSSDSVPSVAGNAVGAEDDDDEKGFDLTADLPAHAPGELQWVSTSSANPKRKTLIDVDSLDLGGDEDSAQVSRAPQIVAPGSAASPTAATAGGADHSATESGDWAVVRSTPQQPEEAEPARSLGQLQQPPTPAAANAAMQDFMSQAPVVQSETNSVTQDPMELTADLPSQRPMQTGEWETKETESLPDWQKSLPPGWQQTQQQHSVSPQRMKEIREGSVQEWHMMDSSAPDAPPAPLAIPGIPTPPTFPSSPASPVIPEGETATSAPELIDAESEQKSDKYFVRRTDSNPQFKQSRGASPSSKLRATGANDLVPLDGDRSAKSGSRQLVFIVSLAVFLVLVLLVAGWMLLANK